MTSLPGNALRVTDFATGSRRKIVPGLLGGEKNLKKNMPGVNDFTTLPSFT